MDCFVPLMEKFNRLYGFYPEYPVADAGYGSYNNYLYCERHGMKKYMKFPMYEKETKDRRYRENPFRAENFRIDTEGVMRCPNGKAFRFRYRKQVSGKLYGRQEEVYECEDCSGCAYAAQCKKTPRCFFANDWGIAASCGKQEFKFAQKWNLTEIHGKISSADT